MISGTCRIKGCGVFCTRRRSPSVMLVNGRTERNARLDRELRCVITTRRPSHMVSSSARLSSARIIVSAHRERSCTAVTLSLPTLTMIRKPPSRSAAMTGIGMLASCSHVAATVRALSPKSLAQRSISGMPIAPHPYRWRMGSTSALMPRLRSVRIRVKSPGSTPCVSSASTVIRSPSCPFYIPYDVSLLMRSFLLVRIGN